MEEQTNLPRPEPFTIRLTIFGRAQQKGSKVPMRSNSTGKLFVKDDNPKATNWQNAIRQIAGERYRDELMRSAVLLSANFIFARIKSHYQTGKHAGELKADVPQFYNKTPDIDKIIRTVCDALSGIVFKDDCQVHLGNCRKLWGPRDMSEIVIEKLSE